MSAKFIQKVIDFSKTLLDPRKGTNKSYSYSEIFMATYSVFHMQSQSFLAHQQRLKHKFAMHNGKTLFGFDEIPSENQMRNVMDELNPCEMKPLTDSLLSEIDLDEFKVEEGLLVALDGVQYFSSAKVSCSCCIKKEHESGTRYYHSMLCPALIHPEQKCALPMAPEFITPQDGEKKQDCEINTAKRWCQAQRNWLQDNKVTILGDDLFSRAPFVKQLLGYSGVRFLLVAKPTSHTYLQEWIAGYTKNDYETVRTTEKMGKKKRIYTYKIYKDIPLNGDTDAPFVNYFEMQVENESGKIIYKNSWITNHKIDKANIHKIARMGRDRWKIENEAFNILKTKGYNLEHNFGHGKKNLAKILACFNLLAFLVHHLMSLHDKLYQVARSHFGARVRFFQALSVVTSIRIFESWEELLAFMSDVFARGEV